VIDGGGRRGLVDAGVVRGRDEGLDPIHHGAEHLLRRRAVAAHDLRHESRQPPQQRVGGEIIPPMSC
jgi:hypothetical protein